VEDVGNLEFSPRKAPPAPVATPDPARAPKPITIPQGTILSVRLTEAIAVDAAQASMTFKSLLDDPVMMGGAVVLPRGTAVALQAVKVEQAGKMKGADKITLKAHSLSFGGRRYDIVTAYVESKGAGEGKKTTRKVAGGAGLGAVIGGIAGGGTGAAIGGSRGRGGRRDHVQPGDRTSRAPGRDSPAVHPQCSSHRATMTALPHQFSDDHVFLHRPYARPDTAKPR
jgi:hypothetical protein